MGHLRRVILLDCGLQRDLVGYAVPTHPPKNRGEEIVSKKIRGWMLHPNVHDFAHRKLLPAAETSRMHAIFPTNQRPWPETYSHSMTRRNPVKRLRLLFRAWPRVPQPAFSGGCAHDPPRITRVS